MYMAMIGMAIVAVPRGVYRALVWLVMGIVGWFLAGVEKAYAAVSWNCSSGGFLTVTSDGGNDCICIYASGDCVIVSNHSSPSVVTNTGGTVNPGDIIGIDVFGNGGTDGIDLSSVSAANGFDHDDLPGVGCYVYAGDGVGDLVYGSDFNDVIYGQGGSDHLYGNGGADTIHHGTGGSGADGSADALYGGLGIDVANYNAGEGDTYTDP
jgi:hypothetical protein